MLKQRVITAIVLLAVLLPALFAAQPLPLLLLVLLVVGAAGWEWARLNDLKGAAAIGTGAAVAALGALLFWLLPQPVPRAVWIAVALVWLAGGAWLLRAGVAQWPHIPRAVRLPLGVLALALAWLAVAQARMAGVNFLLSVLALVWAADIGAYFCGRALGGRLTHGAKLARSISPGKTWEGAAGGLLAVLLLAACWIACDQRAWPPAAPSLYTSLLHAGGAAWLLAAAALLCATSIMGDLLESLVKRSAGVKDSSRLLPGHGGVLDRIDALLPVLPLALALALY